MQYLNPPNGFHQNICGDYAGLSKKKKNNLLNKYNSILYFIPYAWGLFLQYFLIKSIDLKIFSISISINDSSIYNYIIKIIYNKINNGVITNTFFNINFIIKSFNKLNKKSCNNFFKSFTSIFEKKII